ncbi:MAG: hypothetical protein Q4Q06_01960 [Bacteroidota bacterium]|nr:hypothetical protein [Bacteroidota bacterium]
MKKAVFFVCLFSLLIQGNVFAQREKGNVWASPLVGASLFNDNNKVIEFYDCEANVVNSFSWGFNLGYDFSKSYIFLSLEEEGTRLDADNDISLKIKTTNISFNFAYPLWQSKSQKFSVDFRLGVGIYNTDILFAQEKEFVATPMYTGTTTILINQSIEQNYNLFIPVGLTVNLFKLNNTSVMFSCLYRHSFDIGRTKVFGSDKKNTDYAFNKLGSLYLNLGCAIGI